MIINRRLDVQYIKAVISIGYFTSFIGKMMPYSPVISAFTATATLKVREDICFLIDNNFPKQRLNTAQTDT